MPDPSPFEMYVREFELRIKLIETIGKWNKDMAEAEVNWAKAKDIAAKTAIVEKINQELKIAFVHLKREERNAKERLNRAHKESTKATRLKTAKKPSSAIVFAQMWNAFDWYLGESDSKAVRRVIELPVNQAHRSKENFVAVLATNAGISDLPSEYSNFGLLKAWMQSQYLFFISGSAVHSIVLRAMETIDEAREAVVDRLQERFDSVQNQSFKKLGELRQFLGLPAAVEKTPTISTDG